VGTGSPLSNGWSLPVLLSALNNEVEADLENARKAFAHPGEKGDASEGIWISLLQKYLPKRYAISKAHIVDSNGKFSEQIDVAVYDPQYTPLIFSFEGKKVLPVESVYAAFEAKQEMNAQHVAYAHAKVATVRRLTRTSIPVQTISGIRGPKEPHHIIGGLLTLTCAWNPPFGETMHGNLNKDLGSGRLDIGCVAQSGLFTFSEKEGFKLAQVDKPVTTFLFELISMLQAIGTVPVIDVKAYAAHL